MRCIALGLGVMFAGLVYGLFKAIEADRRADRDPDLFHLSAADRISAASLFGLERLALAGLLCALVAFFGLALMIGAHPQHLSRARDSPLRIGAALCRTVFLLVTRAELQEPIPRLTTWYSLMSSTAIFVAAARSSTMHWHAPQAASAGGGCSSSASRTTAAILMLYSSTIRIGPFRTALIMNLEPLMATILSALVLGEVITPLQAVGAAIMLGALVAFQLWR